MVQPKTDRRVAVRLEEARAPASDGPGASAEGKSACNEGVDPPTEGEGEFWGGGEGPDARGGFEAEEGVGGGGVR